MNKLVRILLLSSATATVSWAQEQARPTRRSARHLRAADREHPRRAEFGVDRERRRSRRACPPAARTCACWPARVPSLNVESSFGRAFPRFYIRGYGNGDFRLNASQPVSLIYDDVVQENPILKGFPIFDMDQIEVLRGPQGTLVRPQHARRRGQVRLGEAHGPNSAATSTCPMPRTTPRTSKAPSTFRFGEGWAVRFSGLYQHRDDYVGNALTDEDDIYEGYNDRAARVQVQYEPGENFSALFNAHVRNLDGTARLFRANIIESGSNDLIDGFDADSPIFADGANRQELNIKGGNIRLRWDFGDLALYSITGYESMDAYSRGDIDGGFGCGFCALPNGPGFIPFPSETADAIPTLDQFTQEVRLESQLEGAFNWQAGIYYFDEDYDTEFFSYDSLGGGVQNQYLRANQTNTGLGGVRLGHLRRHRRHSNCAPACATRTTRRISSPARRMGFTFPDPSLAARPRP